MPEEELNKAAVDAMHAVQDDLCLFYDEVYSDEECLKYLHESLIKAREARFAYFRAYPDGQLRGL